ncbi:protein yippee-like PJ691.02 [Macadamia integrifolia]|uniref:protein yippee-like PJ691.02 n=1 Tax=Macadamia integrifolia TaxID=60698 RepID=UPI001C4FC45B|nr:protein yippee-like PJ691.02 [Macadamia integrifolia]XP_042499037.1 protein yippee-like PJ691.02 [Macadamia integrifolia]
MGRLFVVEIPDVEEKNMYSCAMCEEENDDDFPFTHIALEDEREYLAPGPPFWPYLYNCIFGKVMNIIMLGEPERERLCYGRYIVKEVKCVRCCEVLGAYYITSLNPNFSDIEGNFLLHREALNHWDHGNRVD